MTRLRSLCALLALALPACSRTSPDGLPRLVSAGPPVVIEGPLCGRVVIPAPPRRVLPGNAAFVDFVAALLPPERVVALPRASDGFSRALDGPGWSALPRFEGFTGELVLALAPDLLLAHPWQSPEALSQVRDRGVPVLVLPLPRTWDEVLGTLELVAAAVGESDRARELRAALETRVERLRASPWARRGLRALCYSNLGAGGSVAGRATTADILFSLAGMENAAAGFEGYAALDAEGLLALDPDLIVVGERDAPDLPAPAKAFLLGQPVLRDLRAVREQRIVELPAALFSSASYEILTAAERLVAELERGPGGAAGGD